MCVFVCSSAINHVSHQPLFTQVKQREWGRSGKASKSIVISLAYLKVYKKIAYFRLLLPLSSLTLYFHRHLNHHICNVCRLSLTCSLAIFMIEQILASLCWHFDMVCCCFCCCCCVVMCTYDVQYTYTHSLSLNRHPQRSLPFQLLATFDIFFLLFFRFCEWIEPSIMNDTHMWSYFGAFFITFFSVPMCNNKTHSVDYMNELALSRAGEVNIFVPQFKSRLIINVSQRSEWGRHLCIFTRYLSCQASSKCLGKHNKTTMSRGAEAWNNHSTTVRSLSLSFPFSRA